MEEGSHPCDEGTYSVAAGSPTPDRDGRSLRPRWPVPTRSRLQPMSLENAPDAARPHADAELAQLSLNSYVAPTRILPSQTNHGRNNRGIERRPAGLASFAIRPFARNKLPVPAQQGLRVTQKLEQRLLGNRRPAAARKTRSRSASQGERPDDAEPVAGGEERPSPSPERSCWTGEELKEDVQQHETWLFPGGRRPGWH